MDDLQFDPQTGTLRRSDGTSEWLSLREMTALYWTSLAVPEQNAAQSMGIEVSEFRELRVQLAQRLGVHLSNLDGVRLRLSNGDWPRSDLAWADRHAVSLIHRGLDRPEDDVIAHVAGEGAMSVGQVKSIVGLIRSGLDIAGVRSGTLVALDATQRIEGFLVSIAILLQGAAIVRIGDNLPDDVMRDMLRSCPVRMTFSAHMSAFADMAEAGQCVDLESASAAIPSFGDWVADCPADARAEPILVRPDALALVGFTSGSTGRPKRVLNTHQAIWRASEVAHRRFGFGPSDVFCSATDFVAMSGFRSMLTLPLMSGGQVLFLSNEARSVPLAQALECEQYGVTCLTAVPNVLRSFVKAGQRLQPHQLARLRLVLSGSGVLDLSTAQAFSAKFGVRVVDYYAKREIGTSIYSEYSDRVEATTIGNAGGFAAEALIRILNTKLEPVQHGQTGEMFVLTDCLALSAHKAGSEADTALLGDDEQAGWHATGDLARLTETGRIVIAGRSSDAIKSPDGQLVMPLEIEEVLSRHPDVVESCAFSVFRSDGLESVGASVILRNADMLSDPEIEAALRWHIRNALGAHKTPERVLLVSEFPRVARLKPDRAALKQAYQAILSGEERPA